MNTLRKDLCAKLHASITGCTMYINGCTLEQLYLSHFECADEKEQAVDTINFYCKP